MSSTNHRDLCCRICQYLSKRFSKQLGTDVDVRIFDAGSKGYIHESEIVIELRMPAEGLEAVKILDLQL